MLILATNKNNTNMNEIKVSPINEAMLNDWLQTQIPTIEGWIPRYAGGRALHLGTCWVVHWDGCFEETPEFWVNGEAHECWQFELSFTKQLIGGGRSITNKQQSILVPMPILKTMLLPEVGLDEFITDTNKPRVQANKRELISEIERTMKLLNNTSK